MSKKISNPSANVSAESYVPPCSHQRLSVDFDEKILKLSDILKITKLIRSAFYRGAAKSYVPPCSHQRLSLDFDEKILKISDVIEITKVSRSAIYRGAAEGTFPKPIRLGKRSSGWLMSEIKSWLANRIEASRLDQGAD